MSSLLRILLNYLCLSTRFTSSCPDNLHSMLLFHSHTITILLLTFTLRFHFFHTLLKTFTELNNCSLFSPDSTKSSTNKRMAQFISRFLGRKIALHPLTPLSPNSLSVTLFKKNHEDITLHCFRPPINWTIHSKYRLRFTVAFAMHTVYCSQHRTSYSLISRTFDRILSSALS